MPKWSKQAAALCRRGCAGVAQCLSPLSRPPRCRSRPGDSGQDDRRYGAKGKRGDGGANTWPAGLKGERTAQPPAEPIAPAISPAQSRTSTERQLSEAGASFRPPKVLFAPSLPGARRPVREVRRASAFATAARIRLSSFPKLRKYPVIFRDFGAGLRRLCIGCHLTAPRSLAYRGGRRFPSKTIRSFA
jgi:hypothetical protein